MSINMTRFRWFPKNLCILVFWTKVSLIALALEGLAIPILRLLSSEGHGLKVFWKSSKPCHVGIHWIALAEFSQMSTHVPRFQSFSRFLHLVGTTTCCTTALLIKRQKREPAAARILKHWLLTLKNYDMLKVVGFYKSMHQQCAEA